MAKTREIKRRIKGVESTKKITKTMEMVAAAKIKKAQARIEAARPYALKMMDVLFSVAQFVPESGHPLLVVREPVERAVIIPMTSNRGLCGAANTNVLRKAEALYRKEEAAGLTVSFITVGNKGTGQLRYAGYPIERSYTELSDQPTFAEAREIAKELIDGYTDGRVDKIYLVFNHFRSLIDQKPVEHLLLPIQQEVIGEERPGVRADYIFEPSAEVVLNRLLPTYIETLVYRAMMESAASEHSARRMAMKAATDNATDMIDNLTRSYNRARQAQITQEIAEVVAGADAL
ncbi:MAG: ATP synthase F1 subunit gamma [Actinobacteria bacterium]|nr:ATP synthase F1 subunit gamma [Actinomycetota bacterium]